MRLEALKLHGIGPFVDVEIDLTGLADGSLVAVTGPNGAGKSTLLELWGPGAAYRSTPTRGSLAALATARGSSVEARLVNGRPWTIRHLVDAVSGKGESVVLDEHGAPQTPDAKVRSFDAWRRKHLPPEEVLFSTVFAPQGSGGFLAMKPGDRKAVLLRALGIERLEALATAAREHKAAAHVEATTLEARLRDARADAGDVEDLERRVAAARVRARNAEDELAAVKALAESVAREVESVRDAERSAAEHRRRRGDLEAQRARLSGELQDLDRRIANNREVLSEAGAILGAVEKGAELDEEIKKLVREAETATLAAEAHVAEAARLEAHAREHDARERAAEARADRARRRLEDRDRIAAAAADLEDAKAEELDAEKLLDAAEAELERLQGERVDDADGRIEGLRRGLTEIMIGELEEDTPAKHAAVALGHDDDARRRAVEYPSRLDEAKATVIARRDRLSVRRRKVADLEALAARAADLEAAEAELAAAEEEARIARKAAADALEKAQASRKQAAAYDPRPFQARRESLEAELEKLAPLLAKADPLAAATARLEELEPRRAAVVEAHDEAVEKLEAIGDPPPVPPMPDVEAVDRRLADAHAERSQAGSGLAVVEKDLERARAAHEKIDAFEAELAAADAERSDWKRLAADLGRDGLQAVEIDAAGPELTELANDLLRTCHGSRWTVSIETQRASADGKRTLEGCDVRVLDTERGRDALAETLSGGEAVIVGEAVALALSMLACRRQGVEGPTLVRDESGAALDPANAPAYVAMLRRAASHIGASSVLFVSHVPDLWELADARIEVSMDGRVELRS